MIIIFINIFIIIIIFIITNIIIGKIEKFDVSIEDNKCGKQHDICTIDNTLQTNTCCSGLECVKPNGNFQNKRCLSNFGSTKYVDNKIKDSLSDITIDTMPRANLEMPGIDYPNLFNIPNPNSNIAGINLPNLYVPNPDEETNAYNSNLDSENNNFKFPSIPLPNIFTNRFWHKLVSC
jgi:hypothetical protein